MGERHLVSVVIPVCKINNPFRNLSSEASSHRCKFTLHEWSKKHLKKQ